MIHDNSQSISFENTSGDWIKNVAACYAGTLYSLYRPDYPVKADWVSVYMYVSSL